MTLRVLLLTVPVLLLAACAGRDRPPAISLEEALEAEPIPEPPLPVEIVTLPEPLPLPGQLKPAPKEAPETPEPADPRERVTKANEAARFQPSRDGYLNATQVWPFSAGALYQVYASPGRVTDIALQEGETLVSVAAGDTLRWVVGDTVSGTGPGERVHILVKPTRADLETNLVVNTERRTYHLELLSTTETWMASVSWDYPQDRLLALKSRNRIAEVAAPVAAGQYHVNLWSAIGRIDGEA